MKLNRRRLKKIVRIMNTIGTGLIMSAYMYGAFIGMALRDRRINNVEVDF